MKIGPHLKTFRKSRKLGQAQIAAVADVSISAISEWESGKYNPEIAKLIKISQHYGVSMDELIFGPDPKKPNKEDLEFLQKFKSAPLNIQQSIRLILK